MRRVLLPAIVLGPWVLFAVFYWLTPRSDQPRPLEIPASGPLTIAATGDSLIFDAIDDAERDPAFAAIRDAVIGASFAITTLDLNLLGRDEVTRAETRAPPRWPFGTSREAQTIRELGFDAVALANDHAADYGVDGVLSTMRVVSAAGLLHAGTGTDLAQARAPVFAGTPRRIALISVSSSSASESRATPTRAAVAGRPGLNPLRYTADITVDAPTFRTLKQSVATLGAGPPPGDDELTMFGTPIKKGDRTIVSFTIDTNDEREILDQIKSARDTSDAVVVSLHTHEPSNDSDAPAEFVKAFARRAIDSGATLVVGHGPHRTRGVELYKGGAILYSLGNFIFQSDGLDFRAANLYDAGADLYQAAVGALGSGGQKRATPPADRQWWEGAIAVATVEGGGVTALRLLPVDLGADKPMGDKGIPRKPSRENATRILARIAELSKSFGTSVQITGDVADVRGDQPKP